MLAVGHDGVVAAVHVLHSGSGAMALCRVGAGGAGVHFVEPKSMGRAIVHAEPVVGCDGTGIGRCADWVCQDWVTGWWDHRDVGCFGNGGIGAVQADLAHGEFAKLFLVFGGEVVPKFIQCLIGDGADAPHVTCHGEDAGGFKEQEG